MSTEWRGAFSAGLGGFDAPVTDALTLPIVEHFKAQNSCKELDTSQGRESVYALLREQLAPYTDTALLEHPLTEQAEILLGLWPYPRKS